MGVKFSYECTVVVNNKITINPSVSPSVPPTLAPTAVPSTKTPTRQPVTINITPKPTQYSTNILKTVYLFTNAFRFSFLQSTTAIQNQIISTIDNTLESDDWSNVIFQYHGVSIKNMEDYSNVIAAHTRRRMQRLAKLRIENSDSDNENENENQWFEADILENRDFKYEKSRIKFVIFLCVILYVYVSLFELPICFILFCFALL